MCIICNEAHELYCMIRGCVAVNNDKFFVFKFFAIEALPHFKMDQGIKVRPVVNEYYRGGSLKAGKRIYVEIVGDGVEDRRGERHIWVGI